MSSDARSTARTLGLGVLSVIALLLGLSVLLWPGPLAPTDRLPVSLLFIIPGIIGTFRVRDHLDGT